MWSQVASIGEERIAATVEQRSELLGDQASRDQDLAVIIQGYDAVVEAPVYGSRKSKTVARRIRAMVLD